MKIKRRARDEKGQKNKMLRDSSTRKSKMDKETQKKEGWGISSAMSHHPRELGGKV